MKIKKLQNENKNLSNHQITKKCGPKEKPNRCLKIHQQKQARLHCQPWSPPPNTLKLGQNSSKSCNQNRDRTSRRRLSTNTSSHYRIQVLRAVPEAKSAAPSSSNPPFSLSTPSNSLPRCPSGSLQNI